MLMYLNSNPYLLLGHRHQCPSYQFVSYDSLPSLFFFIAPRLFSWCCSVDTNDHHPYQLVAHNPGLSYSHNIIQLSTWESISSFLMAGVRKQLLRKMLWEKTKQEINDELSTGEEPSVPTTHYKEMFVKEGFIPTSIKTNCKVNCSGFCFVIISLILIDPAQSKKL